MSRAMSQQITVGDYVRSYDFPGLNDSTFVEGTVEEIGVEMEGCPRYKIRVERAVIDGRDHTERFKRSLREPYVYPPLNGLPLAFSWAGAITDGVVKIERGKRRRVPWFEHSRGARRADARGKSAGKMVPVVRIERTTYRLQGGCSTPELNRLPTPELCPYLMRRNVGLPPPEGFFGSVGGAGSAVGGLAVVGTASDSPFACTLGLGPSMSKVMPWPVSRA
jgi:hypothetical protein